ncbi:C4-dicarboxylate transport sensor protein dctB [Paramagnetospirillum caucaseum]|uniref:C4-dicarboxylate transport sensor protein dctB n=1 Tax=Paramagnetospirillum caucaseum TaxID=1244869 RepID=M3AGL6_9PROT|nr:cache domain-containing protein [Paramagnetospirillum caucaseum]EME72003.1 C4-dicarboxylate transport sensor protein dctB [Paramagnetospirillum caucaseum]
MALAVAALGGGLAGGLTVAARNDEHLSRLTIEAERRGVEIMSQTLNGNVMGALSLLGAVAQDIKFDARGEVPANLPRISGLLEDVARSNDAQGVFVVRTDGIIHSSWDNSGRPSTGLDVAFRPYYKMAMKGQGNVYAAVSLARGDRALYFTAPVRASAQRDSAPIGAVVARTDLERVDGLLRGRAGIALLLSPQGVVFASSRSEWIGHLAGEVTAERLASIRELRQFGAMFEKADPPVLPFSTDPGIVRIAGRDHVLAATRVRWNDPYGDWSLVVADDLSATTADRDGMVAGLSTGLILLVIAGLLLNLARGQHAQAMASRRIEHYAREQAESAGRKNRRAEAALKFQRAKSVAELGRVFLAEAHDILGALQGAVYVFGRDGAPAMDLAASYAAPPGIAGQLLPGAGLLGQCVLDRRSRVLAGREVEAWSIRSGLGNAAPAGVLMAPLMLDDTPLGAVEIAVLHPPSAADVVQFEELASLLALNLEIQRRQFAAAPAGNEATP